MLPELDPLLHAQLRLQIVSLLMQVDSADFNYLLEKTQASRGNLSVQIKKLAEANYLKVVKSFGDSYPITQCSLTDTGRKAFENYVNHIKQYINLNSKQ